MSPGAPALARSGRVATAGPAGGDDEVATLVPALLEALLAPRAEVPPDRLVVTSVPAPVADADAVLRAAPAEGSFLWEPPAGPACAGLGVALAVEGDGPGRLGLVRERAAAALARIVATAGVSAPRLFGGLAFVPGGASDEPWAGFGDARFVLPRWLYRTDGERATLALAAPGGRADAGALAEELRAILAALAAGPVPPTSAAPEAEIEALPPARWAAHVAAASAAIRRGELAKVVAARRTVVARTRAFDDLAVLAALAAHRPACTRFAFRRGPASFVGATPERLVSRSGAEVRTEALAGTIATGAAGGASLLESRKDLDEHAHVVRAIVEALAPRCGPLEVADRPVVRELRHVLHLLTPIAGTLRRPAHVLELVEALHPTPAVGGVPTEAAVRFIREHEPATRGWYAGPVGWFDAEGDGEFAVALRAGLLAGERAWIYAGAGIVEGSDAAAEWRETELKQRTLLAALGVGAPRG